MEEVEYIAELQDLVVAQHKQMRLMRKMIRLLKQRHKSDQEIIDLQMAAILNYRADRVSCEASQN